MTPIKKRPLKVYRDFLIDHLKSKDLDQLPLDDEAKYRLNVLDDYTAYQAEQLIITFPKLLSSDELKTFFIAIHKEGFDALNHSKETSLFSLFERVEHLFEDEGTFDGVDEKTFIRGLLEGATLETIRNNALRYGLKIPRRIKKAELLAIIHSRSNGLEALADLKKMSVLELEVLAKEKNYYVSIELKKIEMIYYLLDHLKLRKKGSQIMATPVSKPRTTSKKYPLIYDLSTQEFLSKKPGSSKGALFFTSIITLSIIALIIYLLTM